MFWPFWPSIYGAPGRTRFKCCSRALISSCARKPHPSAFVYEFFACLSAHSDLLRFSLCRSPHKITTILAVLIWRARQDSIQMLLPGAYFQAALENRTRPHSFMRSSLAFRHISDLLRFSLCRSPHKIHDHSGRSYMARPAGLEPATLRLRRPLLYPIELRAQSNWSGWRDSNSRPTAPKAVALPGCATPRRRLQPANVTELSPFRQRLNSSKLLNNRQKKTTPIWDGFLFNKWRARRDSNSRPLGS